MPVKRETPGHNRLKDLDGVPRFRNNGRLTTGQRPDLEDLEPVELLTEFHDNNDNGAFEELMNRYGGMVFSTCRRVLRDDHEAEDVTQATFLMLASRHKATKNVHKVGPWLRKVSHRLSLDALRTKKRRVKRENDRPIWNDGEKLADHHVGTEERRRIVRECIDELPVKYRMPIILFHFGGMSRDEIASELGCRANTLGVRLHRARNMLAKSLESRGVTMAGVAMTALLTDAVRTAIGSSMMQQTSVAAGEIAAGNGGVSALLGSDVSAKVLALTESTAALSMGKAKMMALMFAAGSTILTGGGFAAHYAGASESIHDAVENVMDGTPRLFDVQNFWPTLEFPSNLPTIERSLNLGSINDTELTDADDGSNGLPLPQVAALKSNPFIDNLAERRRQWANVRPANVSGDASIPVRPVASGSRPLVLPQESPGAAPSVGPQGPDRPVARPIDTAPAADTAVARSTPASAGNGRSQPGRTAPGAATPEPSTPQPEAPTEVANNTPANDPAPVASPTPTTPTSSMPVVAARSSAPTTILPPSPSPELVAIAGRATPPTQAYAAVLPPVQVSTQAIAMAEVAPPTSVLPSESLFDQPIDPLSDAAPETPGQHTFIAMWDIEGEALAVELPSQFDEIEIAVPYDPNAAAATGAPIERLKLWAFNETDGWERVYDESLYHNITDHIIGGRVSTDVAIVGVSFPEPAVMGLLATGAALLLPRRRR
ncbi:MAG: sigma-70 family RNA polymerase sigma factor [Planctomycetota bacterium]